MGALSMRHAYKTDRRYTAIAALPLLFGLQQLTEGFVWTTGVNKTSNLVEEASLAYMFFSWLAWPVWVPVSTYFLEIGRRRLIYLGFAIAGAMLGALQYFPYFAHEGWLVTRFLPHAISYEGTALMDLLTTREVTYAIYVGIVVGPLLLSSDRHMNIFGILVLIVLTVTYLFFKYAYVSVFCFGGALMSVYLVWVIMGSGVPRRITHPMTDKKRSEKLI